jgi:hypothetical protein
MLSAGYKDKAALERALAVAIENSEVCSSHVRCLLVAVLRVATAQLALESKCIGGNRYDATPSVVWCRGSGCNKLQVGAGSWLISHATTGSSCNRS